MDELFSRMQALSSFGRHGHRFYQAVRGSRAVEEDTTVWTGIVDAQERITNRTPGMALQITKVPMRPIAK
jgi:hypothetical protein